MKYILLSFLFVFNLNGFSQKEGECKKGNVIVELFEGVNVYEFAKNITKIKFTVPDKYKTRKVILYEINFDENIELDTVLKLLRKHSDVKSVQSNHYIKIKSYDGTPNDRRYYYQQQHLNKNKVPQAWGINTGGYTKYSNRQMIIAVADVGFYIEHEDIFYWKNEVEIPNNGIDDDSNGYIDESKTKFLEISC